MRLHVVIRGRVQGVGFRWFVRETATRLDLSGWVKNRDDGGVEVLADGPDASLRLLREALGHGPRGAHVSEISDVESHCGDLPKPFAVVR